MEGDLAHIPSKRRYASVPQTLEPALLHGHHHRLGAILDAEAVQYFLHIALDSIFTQVEPRGYFAARQALGDQAEDDDLLRTEWFLDRFVSVLWSTAQLGQYRDGSFGVDSSLATRNSTDRAFEVEAFNILDDETTRPGLDTLLHQRLVGEGGQDNDGRFRVTFGNGAAYFNATGAGQPHIEQDNIGTQAIDQRERLFTISRVTYDTEIRLG